MAARLDSDDGVAPWDGADAGRQATTMVFEADGGVATDSAPPPAQAAAAASESSSGDDDDDDDDGAAVAGGAAAGRTMSQTSSVSTNTDATLENARQERKWIRKMLRGTKIYFEAASPRDVVLVNAVESGCGVVHKEDKSDITWIEAQPRTPAFVRAMDHQRINFFPGMKIAAHKCTFAKLMSRVSQLYPREFPFIPLTFALPMERQALDEYLRENVAPGEKRAWVVKPDGGCGGDGIYLTDDVTSLKHPECVVQSYVTRPLTIGGLKFDFRLYVAVTSINPLRYYLHREGLARMAVQPYETPCKANFHKLNMHLTNYSLNKFSSDFVDNTDADDDAHTTKRKASTAMAQLRAEYGDDFDEEALWESITELVGKTLGAITPHLLASLGEVPGQVRHSSRCFQLLGFDVLVDREMNPHLLEINHHPSLQTDAPIDFAVKSKVVQPLVRMVALDARCARKADRAKRDFAVPPPEDAADWEAKFAPGTPGAFMPCDAASCAALQARYTAPLMPLLKTFVEACGGATGRTYDEMGSTRFARLCRKLDIAGPGKAFSTPEIDLLFIKCLRAKGYGSTLEFYDFVDAVTGPIGDRISPHTPVGSLQRLRDVTQQLCV